MASALEVVQEDREDHHSAQEDQEVHQVIFKMKSRKISENFLKMNFSYSGGNGFTSGNGFSSGGDTGSGYSSSGNTGSLIPENLVRIDESSSAFGGSSSNYLPPNKRFV